MINKAHFSILTLAVIFSFTLSGCKKDNIVSNEGSVVFWYGTNTSNELIDDGAVSLTYYVDGQIAGSTATNIFWTGTKGPECGQDGSITIKKDIGVATNKTYEYRVIDQEGFEYWKGVVNFTKNSCEAVELVW
jgi:hypothetical protein